MIDALRAAGAGTPTGGVTGGMYMCSCGSMVLVVADARRTRRIHGAVIDEGSHTGTRARIDLQLCEHPPCGQPAPLTVVGHCAARWDVCCGCCSDSDGCWDL